MLTLLDRQLIYSYLKAYLVCLVSLIGLFVIVDLFTHLDDFTQRAKNLEQTVHHIRVYYSNMVLLIFDRLCEAIVLLAAMFTVAWVQRNNELLPLLSAGVSTRRVVRPVLLAAFLTMGLSVLNQELVLPTADSFLLEHRDDPGGEGDTPVTAAYESNGILISGGRGMKKELIVKDFWCDIPPKTALKDFIFHVHAKEARYIPPEANKKYSGGWMLTDTQPATLENWSRDDILEMIVPGQFFLRTQEVDFGRITRSKNWHQFMNTFQLYFELGKSDNATRAAVLFHMRFTRPFLGLLLVFLGLSVILRDQNRNVFVSAGLCLALCAAFFGACFFCKHLGDYEFLSPALAAWLPVLIFGPVSFVMFDAVHT